MNDAGLPITNRAGFQAALRAAFAETADAGCREIWLADTDFVDWPLGERGVVADLTRWVASHRRLHLVAAQFDGLAQRHPRWVAWRRDWAHAVDCRSNAERGPGAVPTLMIAPGHFTLELHDPLAFRGRVSRDAADAGRLRIRLDAVLQQSVAAFPAHVTGLQG